MRKFIKKFLHPESNILQIYRRLYWWVTLRKRGIPKDWTFDVIQAYAREKSNINFVQIGSNNGIDGDPLTNYVKTKGWRGVLVEPVPYLYKELMVNYAGYHGNLKFENSAIANESGLLKFYRLRNLTQNPQWYSQIGSFKKEVLLNHKKFIPHFDDLLMEDTVSAITFKDLISKYNLQNINLLHIDTEGFDYEILKMIPFTNIDIDIILFEHVHLSPLDYKEAQRLLKNNGFNIGLYGKMDTLAVKKIILGDLLG